MFLGKVAFSRINDFTSGRCAQVNFRINDFTSGRCAQVMKIMKIMKMSQAKPFVDLKCAREVCD